MHDHNSFAHPAFARFQTERSPVTNPLVRPVRRGKLVRVVAIIAAVVLTGFATSGTLI